MGKIRKALIITWCNTSSNYGELLQAYALQKAVRRLGYRPITISYLNPEISKSLKKFNIYNDTPLMKYKFNKFIHKHMNRVAQYTDVSRLNRLAKCCDLLICGSDQIWNPSEFEENGVYQLNFGAPDKLRVAYAPSLAIQSSLSAHDGKLRRMAELINRIDFVSVREISGGKILEEYGVRNVATVLDPTFLLTAADWRTLMAPARWEKLHSRRYLLCYILGDAAHHLPIITRIAKLKDIEDIVYVSVMKGQDVGTPMLKNVSPEQFLSLLDRAAFVYTDSFHGTALSINLEKEFLAGNRRYISKLHGGDGRILDILARLGLEDRMVYSLGDLPQELGRIDYGKAQEKLRAERCRSMTFLRNAIQGRSADGE